MKIEVTDENGKKEIFSFNSSQTITVGRSKDCEIHVEGKGISRHHLQIKPENGKWYVLDLGSANGTFVNGEKLTPQEPVEFTTFFPVKIGLDVSLQFLSGDEELPAPTETPSKNAFPSSSGTQTATRPVAASPRPVPRALKTSGKKDNRSFSISLIIVALVLGALVYYQFNPPEDGTHVETVSAAKTGGADTKLVHPEQEKKIEQYLETSKCQSELENKFCQTLGRPLGKDEGVILTKQYLLVFINAAEAVNGHYAQALKKIPADRQEEFLLYFEAFHENRRLLLKKLAIPEIMIINFKNKEKAQIVNVLPVSVHDIGLFDPKELNLIFVLALKEGKMDLFDQNIKARFPFLNRASPSK